jgi:hypothetical protein
MLWNFIREFVGLSLEGDMRGERLDRAIWLMKELRMHGFSSQELSLLSDGKWDSSTIRGYWRE